jgi:hypothetical protein
MDVDGVLLDLFPAVQKYVYRKFNITIEPHMISAWDWDYALGIPVMCHEFWDYVWRSPLVQPYPGAVEFITELKQIGYTVTAVSNRVSAAAVENSQRLFPLFGFDKYYLVKEYMDKLEIAQSLDAKRSLEDNPKTAAALGKYLDSYVLDRPWNYYSRAITGAYTRVYSYAGFINRITKGHEWQVQGLIN